MTGKTWVSGALFAAGIFALFPSAAAAQSSWPEQCRLQRIASFPITPYGQLFTVPVKINGVDKKFLVDTGGYASSLGEDVAKQMGIALRNIFGVRHIDASGKSAEHYVIVDSFKLGAMEATKFDLVANASHSDAFDGTLAPDLLRNFDVEIDYANKTMTFFKPHSCNDMAVYWTQAYLDLPMRITDSGHARVEVALDGKPMDAVLDTGASFSVMTFDDADSALGLKPDNPGMIKAGTMTTGQGVGLDYYTYGFKSLSLGEITLNHPKVRLYNGFSALRSEGAALVMGMSEMHFLRLYFAYHERKLYVSTADAH